jgi:hypothetical protein
VAESHDAAPRRPSRFKERVFLIVITAAMTLALVYGGPKLFNSLRRAPDDARDTALDRFAKSHSLKSVLGEVVFVTRSLYGGDLRYGVSLRGKLRNVSSRPIRDVVVLWIIYGDGEAPFEIWVWGTQQQLSVFTARIDYLDTKAEADFNIEIELSKGIDTDSARKIRDAIAADRQEAGLYVKQ